MSDEFVEEIHEIRKRIVEECNCDFRKLAERFIRRQDEQPELLVAEVPKTESEPLPT